MERDSFVNSFTGCWHDAKTNPPTDFEEVLAVMEVETESEPAGFERHWASYSVEDERWYCDDVRGAYTVLYWTEKIDFPVQVKRMIAERSRN